jgi:hypothetical protein
MVTAFEAARGAGENDFRHWWSLAKSTDFVLVSSGSWQTNPAQIKGPIERRWALKRRALGELEAAF